MNAGLIKVVCYDINNDEEFILYSPFKIGVRDDIVYKGIRYTMSDNPLYHFSDNGNFESICANVYMELSRQSC